MTSVPHVRGNLSHCKPIKTITCCFSCACVGALRCCVDDATSMRRAACALHEILFAHDPVHTCPHMGSKHLSSHIRVFRHGGGGHYKPDFNQRPSKKLSGFQRRTTSSAWSVHCLPKPWFGICPPGKPEPKANLNV